MYQLYRSVTCVRNVPNPTDFPSFTCSTPIYDKKVGKGEEENCVKKWKNGMAYLGQEFSTPINHYQCICFPIVLSIPSE